MAINKITEKTAVNAIGSNAYVLITQDVTANGETYQDVRRIDFDTFADAVTEDLTYVPIDISSFTANPASAEKGSTVTSVTLSYSLNKVPTELTLGDTTLTNAQTGTESLTSLSLTGNTSWTLTAKDAGSRSNSAATATKTASLSFLNKAYWGVAEIPGTLNSTFILGLTNSVLTASKARTISVDATSGKYIWYAVPASLGSCTFKVGGFDGGFEAAQTVSFTNASGYTENYSVYRSTNASLGSTTVVIS